VAHKVIFEMPFVDLAMQTVPIDQISDWTTRELKEEIELLERFGDDAEAKRLHEILLERN
jgi:hypothetical protein